MENNNEKEKEKKNLKQSKIKLNKFYSPRRKGEYEILTTKKKIENEISSITKENRNDFVEALNKYNFDTEVFIPRSMSINKNEYKNKNYLLNNLVLFESKAQERKRIVEPLRVETNRFTKQYKLIKEENEEHQKEYLKGLENYYQEIGYNVNSIEYQNTDNIFKPSSVLDHDFGMNLQEDSYKYSDIDLKKDYSVDQNLLKKWQKGIEEAKEKKSRAKIIEEENEMPGSEKEEKREKEREREYRNIVFQKELDKIKNKLMEENRIRNMSREQYFYYNRQIKNDIKNTKKLLKEFNESKNNSYFNPNKLKANTIDSNRVSRTYKILHPTQNKNYKEKIVFSSLDLSNKKEEKKIKKEKSKKIRKNYLSPKYQIPDRIKNNSTSIPENNLFISSDKNKIKNDNKISLPLILFDQDNENENKNDYKETKKNKNKMNKEEIKSGMFLKKKQKENELENLYNLIYNNKNTFLERYPSKSVEKYFRKYTNKKIPVVNFKKGSNIHGIIEDLQNIVKKNEFYKIAESSNEVKEDILKKGLSNNKLDEDKGLDIDMIQELDERIPELNYYFAENLLLNKIKENNKK